ncbi:MAG TPA: Rid family detoxifying hydrolase [Thermoanaerobaculia bacterium]
MKTSVLILAVSLTACVSVREVPVPPTERRAISSDKAPAALATYSQAILAGDTLYLAGQIGLDPATRQLVPGGLQAEARRALDNCRAVLEAAGFSLADVTMVQVYLADIGDYEAFNQTYAGYFPNPQPARAVVAVAGLPRGAKVEILMTAVRRR